MVLQDVASWHKVNAFGKEGADALGNVHRRAQSAKKAGDVKRSGDHNIAQLQQEGREEEEVIKVVDEE